MAETSFDHRAIRERAEAVWTRTGGRDAVVKATADGPRFAFLDGPPYTSGHIHLGTAWNKVIKDSFIRYLRHRGYNVRDQPGYDMHGLPIEVKVEKELDLENKKQIEEMGVGAFIEQCKEFSLRFLDTMNEEFKDLGVWMDWDRPYRTIDPTYVEAAWGVIKAAQEKDLLDQADRNLSWCPRCETALAEAEVEYWDETDPSIYVAFPLAEGQAVEGSLLIWTTTPWTLPANVAIAAHPDLEYVSATFHDTEAGDQRLVLAAELVEEVAELLNAADVQVHDTFTGADLEGLRYEHVFAQEVPFHREPEGARNSVILGDHVTAERTGLVHTATGHGVEDQEAGAEAGIDPYCVLAEDGTYNDLAGDLEGLTIDEANDRVIELLRDRGPLLHDEQYTHRYGHCWRCKTPILYRTTRQWFLRITQVKDKMLEEVDRVTWTPEWAGSARQKDWVQNARDWCITRQRYWGIPLPVWTCEEGHRTVVGDRAQLEDLSGTFLEDPHRPYVDDVTFACPDCGTTATREPDVLDVWFDSACASFASLTPEEREVWWPAELIIEGLDQTRGWFYSQLAAGVVAHDRCPYDEVVMHAFVHDTEGRPMSKSLGNIVKPQDVVDEVGADAMRLSLLQTAPWDDLHYGPDLAKEAARTLNILWNVHQFHLTYRRMDNWQPGDDGSPSDEDQWLRIRRDHLVRDCIDAMEARSPHRAVRHLQRFILEDLSRWYVRLVRSRAWKGEETDRSAVHATLHEVLLDLATILAPFTPYVAEVLNEDLTGGETTIHVRRWPETEASPEDEAVEAAMDITRSIVEAVAQARAEADVPLRWPVPRITVTGDEGVKTALDAYEAILLDQCNAKEAVHGGDSFDELVTVAVPVPKAIGPVFKGDAQTVIDALKAADGAKVEGQLEAEGKAEVAGFEIQPEMVTFKHEMPEEIAGGTFEGGSVYVDLHLDEALEAEGMANEVLRRVQVLRKEADLDLDAQAEAIVHVPDETASAIEPHVGVIEEEGRVEVHFGELPDPDRHDTPGGNWVRGAWDVRGVSVEVALRGV